MAGRKRDNERDRVCFVRSFYFVSFIVYLLLPTGGFHYEEMSTRRYLLEDAVISFIRANLLLLTSK